MRSTDSAGGLWAGDLPSHWSAKRLKYVASLVNDKVDANVSDLPYLGLENIESFTGKLIPSVNGEAAEGPASRFRPGDVLFGKLRPYLSKAFAPDFEGLCTGEALVLRPHSVRPRYIFYCLLSSPFISLVDASTYGAKMPRASWDFIGNVPVPLPTPDEQEGIAIFLDRETAKIDGLIAQKRRLIELLNERRTAFVSQAVTGGLDNASARKPSGVATVGMIPSHWEVCRAKSVFREVDDRTESGDEELLTVSHITGVTPRSEKQDVTMFMAETLEGYKRCRKNDLVINTMWAWMGALGISKFDGVVSPSYNVYRLRREVVPDYLDYLYRTPPYVAEITRWSKGVWSSRLRLYPDAFFQIRTILPPFQEQIQIVEAIRAETSRYDAAIETLQRSCDRLLEYRATLITDAVTGRIRVPTGVAVQPRKRIANKFYKRAVLAAEILSQLHQQPELGQIKLQKVIYVCEHHAQLADIEGSYLRNAAGPHDNWMMRSVEARLEDATWFKATRRSEGFGTEYVPLENAGQHLRHFESYWGSKRGQIQAIIDLLRPLKTRQAEIVATLYAAWNDLIFARREVTDEAILHEVLLNWHERKAKIPEARWRKALQWMREKGLVPTGFGKPTKSRAD